MNAIPFPPILAGLIADISSVTIHWQVAAVLLCWALGWLLARVLRRVFSVTDQPLMQRIGSDSFARVLVPIFTLIFVYLATQILSGWLQPNLLRLAVPIFIAAALIRLAFYLLYPIIARAGKNASVLRRVEKIFALLVWVWVLLHLTGLWPHLINLLDNISFSIGDKRTSLLALLQGMAAVVITVLVALWLSVLLERRLMRMQDVGASMRLVLSRTLRAVLIICASLVALSMVGIDLTVLSVFGGALGVGLGLGLQRIASNYVSGFIILLERSLNIGDLITVPPYSGRVTEINTRYTVLQGLDGVEAIVPNEILVSNTVQNHSLSDRSVWLSTDILIGYHNDIDQARKVMEEAAAGVERVSKEKPPRAQLMKFAATGFDFRVGFWIEDPEKGSGSVISAINQAVWEALQKNGIDVPYGKDAPPCPFSGCVVKPSSA